MGPMYAQRDLVESSEDQRGAVVGTVRSETAAAPTRSSRAVAVASSLSTRVRRSPLLTELGPPALHRRVSRVQRGATVDPPSSEPPVIRREFFPDEGITYGEKTESLRAGFQVLKKPKVLRGEASITSRRLAVLPAGKKVEMQPSVTNSGGRSWARVETNMESGKVTGYINTKDDGEHVDVEHQPVGGAIMAEDGPKMEDIEQHMLGTCFLLAPLMSMVSRTPDAVRQLFKEDPTQPANQYTVYFYPVGRKGASDVVGPRQEVTVSATTLAVSSAVVRSDGVHLPAGTAIGSKGTHPWPAIIEKAYMAWPQKVVGGDGPEGGHPHHASMYLTGDQYHKTRSMTGTEELNGLAPEIRLGNQQQILDALKGGGLIAASTKNSPPESWKAKNIDDGVGASGGEAKVGGIAFKHVYEVVTADGDSITLRNPWGSYARVRGEVRPDGAESVLSWAEFWEVCATDAVSIRTEPIDEWIVDL